ncbi:twin-arginine translocase TatA/TatE family subunit [Sphingomonas qilianensis]|uniref:Sec-independent protein translocase protein TatA n=1 Tax=Sphingomonas qilianensis TaxID=1736690 RepID=A0ABU9XPD4_9SPHN
MGGLSIWHWLVVGVIVMLLFGKGRFSDMMGDVAKGLKSFKKGMADEEDERTVTPAAPSRIDAKPAADPAFDRDGEKLREERP